MDTRTHQTTPQWPTGLLLAALAVSTGNLAISLAAFYAGYRAERKLQQQISEAAANLATQTDWGATIIGTAKAVPDIFNAASNLALGMQDLTTHVANLGGLRQIIDRDSRPSIAAQEKFERAQEQRAANQEQRDKAAAARALALEEKRVELAVKKYEAQAKAADAIRLAKRKESN